MNALWLESEGCSESDPLENGHLNVKKITKNLKLKKKKLTKIVIFFNKIAIFVNFFLMSSFWQFFDIQLTIFRRVSSELDLCVTMMNIFDAVINHSIYNFFPLFNRNSLIFTMKAKNEVTLQTTRTPLL